MERKYKKVSFAEAEEIIESRPERLIFDVREEEEYNLGHAKGALLFPVDSITRETAAEQIPAADTPLAAEKLAALGYTQVYDVGSLAGWPYGLEW